MTLPLMGGMLNAPSYLPHEQILACNSYRDAVRLSWASRRIKGMTKTRLCELAELYSSHVTDYLANDDARGRRNLPADKLGVWACVTGNFGVQQWLQVDAERQLLKQLQERTAA